MRGKALYRWVIRDKHTRTIHGAYSTERGARNAAARMCEIFSSPGRYVAEKR